ncbi:hypothetical protein [Methanosarcina horonobensis]|uniref:hypothetical protein n=2 Tax=Methanosarcina horonobensis TaxID=418008 RepID=UPI00064FC056|nr:hypothetical protein [Methanosarcina horonobensis]
MKLYSISLFLLMVNISIALLVGSGIIPVQIQTLSISESDFSSNVPDQFSYSNADIGLYLFGDFPRAIGMLAKIFIFSPIILALLLSEAGLHSSIVGVVGICLWIIYLAGIAQLVMKYSLEGNS